MVGHGSDCHSDDIAPMVSSEDHLHVAQCARVLGTQTVLMQFGKHYNGWRHRRALRFTCHLPIIRLRILTTSESRADRFLRDSVGTPQRWREILPAAGRRGGDVPCPRLAPGWPSAYLRSAMVSR